MFACKVKKYNGQLSGGETKAGGERSGSSVEALGSAGQDEEHDPMRRILKQRGSCESTQCKLLLVMTRSHSPPACAELTAASCKFMHFRHV